MTIGSLFSGIGGLELGLERAGLGPVLWQAESDPFARAVLRDHWPHAERFADVRFIRSGRVAVPDVICGGFPCQDLSSAGTGRGLEGERSGLWFEFARVVRDLRPRFVVVENVAALRRRGLGTVLGDLAACGYDAMWDCIPASALGAPHRRDRLFVVAWRVSDAERDELRDIAERRTSCAPSAEHGGDAEPRDVGAATLAHADLWRSETERVARDERASGDASHGCDLPRWPPGPRADEWRGVPAYAQPAVRPLAHGIPTDLLRPALRATGNAVVIPVAEVIGRIVTRIAQGESDVD